MDEKDRSAAPDFSSALDGILGDPQMMSMISSMAQKLKDSSTSPNESAPQTAQESSLTQSTAPNTSASLPLLEDMEGAFKLLSPLLGGGHRQSDDKLVCLLRALKTYLNKNRCEAIDMMITVSGFSEIFKSGDRR